MQQFNRLKSKEKPQVGVSACLARHPVRYDGSYIANPFVNGDFKAFFNLHAVCPEVEMGMSTPRDVIQLRDFEGDIRLVYSKKPEIELTEEMTAFSEQRIAELPTLDGYIFKKDSPSCGVYKVPVKSNKTGMRTRNGMGIFAKTLKTKFPNLPTEDEGRMNDTGLRENFLERVYAHKLWREIAEANNPVKEFREFHKNYKLMIMAKDLKTYRALGRLAATVNEENFAELKDEYFNLFMQAMVKLATQGQHVNVMQHVMGYLKKSLNKQEKEELLTWFDIYKRKQVGRITPLALLLHHFKNHPNHYVTDQLYFAPFPGDLMLPR